MEQFIEDVKNFGVANWILIGCLAFIMILLIVLVIVNIKIMKKYRLDLTRARLARVVGKVEIIDGWCCIVIENVGQVTATNVKIKAKGSIMKYYYNYVTKCRVTNAFDELCNRRFTLVAGDRRQIRLFPVSKKNVPVKTIMESRRELRGGEPDVNLVGKTEPSDMLEIDELVDSEDAAILKLVGKEQERAAKAKAKSDAAYAKKVAKIEAKKQDAIVKMNKKQGKETHTSLIEQPDLKKVRKNADVTITIEFESLGYLMKNNKFSYKHLDLNDHPELIRSEENILAAQNGLLKEIVYLQEEIRKVIGKPTPTDE